MKTVIIGGVAGGAGTAARLRRNDEFAEIVLLEKDAYISYANCGLPYYIGNVIVDEDELLLQTPESFYNRFRVDVRVMNQVVSVNSEEKYVTVLNRTTGETYQESYDHLVLSPGAVPVKPSIPGVAQEHVFTLRNVQDTYGLKQFLRAHQPQTAVVVGAGFIGLEMAENLKRLGMQVTLVEAQNHVLAALDEDMAYDVHNHIREQGIHLVLEDGIAEIGTESVLLTSGKRIDAQLVLLSIGVRPATAFLRDSGIQLGAKGEIIVNNHLETSVSDIYALGDAAMVRDLTFDEPALVPLASIANKQARIVADRICGKSAVSQPVQGTAIVKVFDLTVGLTGANERSLCAHKVSYEKTFTFSASHAGYYPGGEFMFIKLLFQKTDGLLLGAQIVGGAGVDKRIDVLAAMIRQHATVYDLTELELAYAPPFSSAKDPVNMAGFVAENVLSGQMKKFDLEDIKGIQNGILLDTRTAEEFANGSIEHAQNIPLDELRERLDELNPQVPIYIFCQIGLRGYIAYRILKQRGFQVANLTGGYYHYQAYRKDQLARNASQNEN